MLSTLDLSGLSWRKSGRSGQDTNGSCVDVAFARAEWRKSSRSGQDGSNGNCVEVAFAGPAVAVRDSKSPNEGVLAFPSPGWSSFLRTAQR